MRVRRREFMHLLGAQGLGASSLLTLACADDGGGTGGGSGSGSTGGSSGAQSSTGAPMGSDATGSDGVSSSEGDGSSSDESTGEAAECEAPWWLCGNYSPVDEHEAFEPRVEGRLPPALDGLYLRNGPNPFSGSSEHWFVGDGMVHGVRLGGGAASWYRARYIETAVLGQRGSGNPFDYAQHQANTSVVSHAGRLMCLSEVGLPYELSPRDLSTLGTHDFAGQLAGPMTAHPKIDPQTGELVFFGYGLLDPIAEVHTVDPKGALVRSETITLPTAVMMHDFQLTASHVVLLDLPVAFDLDLAVAGESLPFAWRPDNGARIGILPREGTAADVVWVEIDVGYTFHTFNAYDDEQGNVVLDAIWYPQMWVESPGDFATDGAVVRFVVDPVRGSVERQVIYDGQCEFPEIDPRRQGLRHRYGYAISSGKERNTTSVVPAHTVLKHDLERGTVQAHTLEGGLNLDELTFVPDSAGAGEDEGWLVGYAYDPHRDASQLLVLDATDLRAGPVARVHLPQRVPHGFHGTWVPSP